MNIEKMREEFEAWFRHAPGLGGYDISEYWDGTGYQDHGGSYWACWKASRAAIEIELPKERSVNGHWPEQVASDMGFNDGVELCREAIESLGLKVKP